MALSWLPSSFGGAKKRHIASHWYLLALAAVAFVFAFQEWMSALFEETLIVTTCLSFFLLQGLKDKASQRFLKRAPCKAAVQGKAPTKENDDHKTAADKPDEDAGSSTQPLLQSSELDAGRSKLVTFLISASKAENFQECELIMKRLVSLPCRVPAHVYGVLISAYAKAGMVREAENWLNALVDAGHGPPKLTCVNVIISACAKKQHLVQAERWIHKMPNLGVLPDVVSYNAVIAACISKRDGARAEEWFEHMQAAGIQPNSVTFSSIINACSKANDEVRTRRWLDRVPDDVFSSPTAVCFGTLIGASAKVGRIDVAEKWLERFISSGLEPNVISFNILIAACSRTGDVHRAKTWYFRMLELGVQADVITHNGLIAAFTRNRDVAGAEAWLCRMDSTGVSPNFVSYCALIHASAKENNSARAEKWLTYLMAEPRLSDVSPQLTRCFNAVVHALSREGKYSSASAWIDQMTSRGCEPTAETFSTTISRLSKRGSVEQATQWLENMIQVGVVPDARTLTFVLRAHLKWRTSDSAHALIKRMEKRGAPNAHIMNKLGRQCLQRALGTDGGAAAVSRRSTTAGGVSELASLPEEALSGEEQELGRELGDVEL